MLIQQALESTVGAFLKLFYQFLIIHYSQTIRSAIIPELKQSWQVKDLCVTRHSKALWEQLIAISSIKVACDFLIVDIPLERNYYVCE